MISTCSNDVRNELLQERATVGRVLSSFLKPLGFEEGRLLSFALVGYSLGPGYRHEFTNNETKEIIVLKAPSHSKLDSSFRSQIWRNALKSPMGEKKWRDLRHIKDGIEEWVSEQRTFLETELRRKYTLLTMPQDGPTTIELLDWILSMRGFLFDALLSRHHMRGNGRFYSRSDLNEAISTHIMLPGGGIRSVWYKTDFAEKLGETYLKSESNPIVFEDALALEETLDSWLNHAREHNTIIKVRPRKIRNDSPESQMAEMRLRGLANSRVTIRATVDRIALKNGWNGFVRRLFSLKNVTDTKGTLLGEYFWVNDCKQFKTLELAPGDEIEFSAKIERILLDRQSPPDPLRELDEEIDHLGFRIARPNKVKILKKSKNQPSWW
jgi:hypothetical protein